MYKKLISLIIILVFIFVILIYLKNNLLYHPSPAVPEKYDRFYEKLLLLTESKNFVKNYLKRTVDGNLLDTIYVKNPDSMKCIIFFHGNAGNISMRFDMIKFLYNFASVVVFDYRSFGKSSGENTFLCADGLYKDADAIWNFVVNDLKYAAKNISLFGESLGCAVAIHLAAQLSKSMDSTNYPHSLILNAPFCSLASMIELMFDKIHISYVGKIIAFLVGREYQSDKWLSFVNHTTKIIIAHSPRDEVIPYKEGQTLYISIASTHRNVKFINIAGTHNNLGLTDDYIYALAELFNE